MKKMKNCAVQLTVILVGFPVLAAAESPFCSSSSCEDSTAVSSLLLAAGMYGGIDSLTGEFSLSRSANTFKSLAAAQGPLEGQDITLSYEGSSGSRVGLSAGKSYPNTVEKQEIENVLPGIDSFGPRQSALRNESETPWYLTFNLAKEFQVSDSLAFGLDSKAMLLSAPSWDSVKESDNQAVCMSLNLPVSYGNFLTVTPELQWSRVLEPEQQMTGNNLDASAADRNADTFYGGMSITLSY